MKKLKISRASTAAFLIIVLVLISTAKILTIEQITSDSLGKVSKSEVFGIQNARVVVDIDLLKEQNHSNKQVDKVHDDGQNDPITNLTKIMAEHIKTETNDTE